MHNCKYLFMIKIILLNIFYLQCTAITPKEIDDTPWRIFFPKESYVVSRKTGFQIIRTVTSFLWHFNH